MDTKDILHRVESLLRGRGLDGYEVAVDRSRSMTVEVSDGRIETFRSAAPSGVALRVLKEGGLGFSFSTSLEDPALSAMVENAVIGAAAQTPDPCHCFAVPGKYPEIPGMLDPTLAGVPEEEKISRAMELERLTLAADPRIRKVRKATYAESVGTRFIVNSLGVCGEYTASSVSSSVSAIAEENGDTQMGWDFGYATSFGGVETAGIAAGAAARATGLLGARKIGTMRCPAVLDRYVAAEILEVLAPAFLAENVQKGKSLLAGKKGAHLFSERLRIRDDGTLATGMSTSPFDGEGVASADTVLVENGIVTGFLYDTLRACRDGVRSTGNGVRDGIRSPVRMGITNFFIENGSASAVSLMEGMDRGILVTEVMGMHTANPISGDFSVGAAGFLIENGAVSHPVREIAIAGNILEVFGAVEKVADDLRFYGAVGSPSLLVSSLDVSGH